MATLYSQAKAFAKKFPHPNTGQASWDQMCGALMYRFCSSLGSFGPTKTGPNAVTIRAYSYLESTDASKAPIGAFHWWSIGANGHVGIDVKGKGKTVFMATIAVTTILGKAIGFSSVANYSKAKHAVYKGWSRDYAGAHVHLDGTSTAGTGGTVILKPPVTLPTTLTKETNMRLLKTIGNPATFAHFDGLFSVREGLSVSQAQLIKQFDDPRDAIAHGDMDTKTDKETDAEWAKRRDAILAFWKESATYNAKVAAGTTTASAPDANSAWLVRVVRAIGAAITATK